jgi:hypothetical protein
VTREAGAPGRPKQSLLRAVAQHLYAGGYSPAKVAQLIGSSAERARNAIRTQDARWYGVETGTRPLPTPRNT